MATSSRKADGKAVPEFSTFAMAAMRLIEAAGVLVGQVARIDFIMRAA